MSETTKITASAIRQYLLTRAREYSERTKTPLSTIGIKAIGDARFLPRAEMGNNFTIETYQRVIDWLDAQDQQEQAA